MHPVSPSQNLYEGNRGLCSFTDISHSSLCGAPGNAVIRKSNRKGKKMNNNGSVHSSKLNLLSTLSYYANNGIRLFVQNEPLSPEQTVRTVMESGKSYMADYVEDDRGLLSEIRFDRVDDIPD